MGRNEKIPVGIPWEWELITKLGLGMGRNENAKSHSRSSLMLCHIGLLFECELATHCDTVTNSTNAEEQCLRDTSRVIIASSNQPS